MINEKVEQKFLRFSFFFGGVLLNFQWISKRALVGGDYGMAFADRALSR